jgi:hypothetical protein
MDLEVHPSYASEIPQLYSFQSYGDGPPSHIVGTIICEIMLFTIHTKYCYINLYQCLRYSDIDATVGCSNVSLDPTGASTPSSDECEYGIAIEQ